MIYPYFHVAFGDAAPQIQPAYCRSNHRHTMRRVEAVATGMKCNLADGLPDILYQRN
jgi:hypothetical protein